MSDQRTTTFYGEPLNPDPVGEIKKAENGKYYWRIMQGNDCLAIAPINDHRPSREQAAADLIQVVNCALPLDSEFRHHHRARMDALQGHEYAGFRAGRVQAWSELRRIGRAILAGLVVAGFLVLLVLMLSSCSLTRAARPPLSVSPATGDGPRAATDQPILQGADRTIALADDLEAAVGRYDVPQLVAEVKPHADGIRSEQTTIKREATALANFANKQNSGPWRLWAWMMAVGMGLGAIGILLGIGLAIWAGRPKAGALTAASGLAVLVTSYVLAAYIRYIIWGGVGLLVAGIVYALWTARKNLYADPPAASAKLPQVKANPLSMEPQP